ncbi:MAG: DUF2188 domain-containing protein [Bacteroidetes bacterium]|nr:DUF2188 domain-containing protein [Bacteroidota bacterium]
MVRAVYYVSPTTNGWKVTKDGVLLSSHYTKEVAVETAKTKAKANKPSQVIVQKKDGTFETEYTYQDDPYPPRG